MTLKRSLSPALGRQAVRRQARFEGGDRAQTSRADERGDRAQVTGVGERKRQELTTRDKEHIIIGDQDQDELAWSRQIGDQELAEPANRQIEDSGASVDFTVDQSSERADAQRIQEVHTRVRERIGRYHYEVQRHAAEALLRQLTHSVQWRVGESVHYGAWQIRPAVGWARVGDYTLCVCVLIAEPAW